jgi:hypothetical protein
MSLMQYHALWIAIALSGIAVASAVITQRLRVRELRRLQAEQALEALARYCEWLAAQRRVAVFQGEPPPERSPLVQLCALQQAAFPDLCGATVALLLVHARMLDFLWRQQSLREADAEAWLESDHDARFLALWREHGGVVHELADRLRQRAGVPLADAQPEAVFPA